MKFRLDPFPQVSETLLNSLLNARILIFSIVVAKIMLDRLYKYAVVMYYGVGIKKACILTKVVDYQSFGI